MDYLSPLSNNLGYVLAVEKLLGLEVPPRAVTVRLLLAELMRIASHLVWLGTTGLDLGVQSMIMYAFDLREGILDMFEEVSGARMNPSYFRVGGLAADLTPEFERMLRDWLQRFPKRYEELRALMEENPIFLDCEGSGRSRRKTIAWGLRTESAPPGSLRRAKPFRTWATRRTISRFRRYGRRHVRPPHGQGARDVESYKLRNRLSGCPTAVADRRPQDRALAQAEVREHGGSFITLDRLGLTSVARVRADRPAASSGFRLNGTNKPGAVAAAILTT